VAGQTPASVAVTVLPPIYARWWFIVLAALVVGGAGLLAYRARVAQLLRVERVRAGSRPTCTTISARASRRLPSWTISAADGWSLDEPVEPEFAFVPPVSLKRKP
jgi:hypothetical protein